MRTAVTVALMLVLMGVVALCPALACFSPAAAHPCCPRHAPAPARDCATLVLEKGKVAPIFSAAIPAPAPSGAPAPQFTASLLPVEPATEPSLDLLLLLRTLRI